MALLVPDKGLEPLRLAAREPKSRVSANSANPANNWGELNWLSYSRRTFLLSKEFCGFYIQCLHHKAFCIKWVSRKPSLFSNLYFVDIFILAFSWLEVRKRNTRQSLQHDPRKAITELVSKPLRNNIVSTFYFSSWIRTLGITLSSKRPEHIFTLLWRYGDLGAQHLRGL